MTVQVLSTSNTFLQWVTETQKMLFVVNQFTDGVLDPTNYSNTNIRIGNNLDVIGDLGVSGFLDLDDVENLYVTGNVDVTGTLDSDVAVLSNLVILNNLVSLNTTTLNVGTEATLNTLSVFDTINTSNIEITGEIIGAPNLFATNLVVTGNVETLNVSSELFIGSDASISGNLLSFLCCESGLNLTGDLSLNLAFIDTATVTTLIGTANTNIYNNIFASNAYTSVQNTLAEFASFSCILG
jgi:hypothetical protein